MRGSDALFEGEQHIENRKQSGLSWLLRVPADIGFISRKRHATIQEADAGPAEPLSRWQWKALLLALDGVADDTCDPAAIVEGDEPERFHWDGLIPLYGVTLLAGAPKAGKSTLLRALFRAAEAARAEDLRSREAAGDGRDHERQPVPFLGREVDPFRSLVVSEERPQEWRGCAAGVRLRFFTGRPVRKGWSEYVDGLGKLASEHFPSGRRLVVLDSLSRIVGVDENNARQVTRAMAPVREMAGWGGALVVHHLNRSGGVRGSSALEAQVDHVLTLEAVNPDDITDARRILTSIGRSSRPFKIEFEMKPDGTLELTAPVGGGKGVVGRSAANIPAYLAPKNRGV